MEQKWSVFGSVGQSQLRARTSLLHIEFTIKFKNTERLRLETITSKNIYFFAKWVNYVNGDEKVWELCLSSIQLEIENQNHGWKE